MGPLGVLTSQRHKTHVTETGEVLYPWHPWFGRVVHIGCDEQPKRVGQLKLARL
jgi:hypothetical protein